ncbi:MAG: hypothetical protein WBM90_10270 [Acidimicrobiia bacterium]
MVRRFLALLLLVIFGVACASGDDSVGIDGRWDGGVDWGEIIINNLEGTYSATFGSDPGTISLTEASNSHYTGTWAEGTDRFGTLDIELESNDLVVGEWTADPESNIPGSSGGLLRWERD